MADYDLMEHNDFRVVASASVNRKGSTASAGPNAKIRYTLGEVTSANITLDVNVGSGWTRIKLKEVPKFLVHAFNMITIHGMTTDGIFRREGATSRLNQVDVPQIYRGQCDISGNFNVHDVCSMVKRFLRDLKPTLLDSEEFRARLLKKAIQARISSCFVMTRDEMAEMFYKDVNMREQSCESLLSDVHLSTLGYVMRQLNRISNYHAAHKMDIDNLSTVFVASVFGDGIHVPKKGGQIRRGSKDDILATKQDNEVNKAAVKLLITNANLIGVRPNYYVSSGGAILRSSSAMPRCMSSGYETGGSSDPDCMSTKTSSTLKSAPEGKPGPSSILRRDSEAAHKIVTSRKKAEHSEKKKRSASFLPSFRDFKQRFTKRPKSPSPERLTTGHAENKFTDTTSSSDLYTEDPLVHRKKVARNESNTMSTGSTASGRQSRSHQSRRANTNAAPRLPSNPSTIKPTIAKLFDSAEQMTIPSSGALRRLSASDQNADAIRFAVKNHHRLSNEQMSVTEFLMSEHERERSKQNTTSTSHHASKILKRNTMVLGEKSTRSQSGTQKNRRHTAPINNNRPRRNRPNTVGTGLPPHRKDSSMEEKENQADCETDDTLDPPTTLDHSEWLLEQKALEARSRRAGRKQKNSAAQQRNQSTDSMMVLNGSMAVDLDSTVVQVEPPLDSVKEESPQKVILRKDLDEVKRSGKQFCDMATSPMLMANTPKQSSSSPGHHENGHVWVGTKQVVNVTPTPSITRRQSRARLSYSKANESGALDMPMRAAERRESSPLMSPILRHVTITNNSPPAQLITTPRTSLTPKTHTLSPLVLKMESTESTPTPTPPPVPRHSPPYMTPQTSRGSVEPTRELKRISISGTQLQPPRRPPTPPSHPKMSNPFSPRLPIRSVTIDNGFELPSTARDHPEPSPHLFKLPQLPLPKKQQPQVSPLARQSHASKSTLSVPNRANLRESKSIEESTTQPLRSAPLHGASSSQLSPRTTDYFEFGKYTSILRNAGDEFALPSRKPCIEPRPSVAIIRTNNCGLVKSRVNHFQEIEQLQRIDSSMSGRLSALSQTSLRSNDTHQSSSDRFSDVSDLRNSNLTSSDSTRSIDSTPNTPTARTAVSTTSRVSYDSSSAHHF